MLRLWPHATLKQSSLSGKTPDKIVFAAGASKSAHWSQILSNATGLPVVTPIVKEATALGCAAAAAIGVGLRRDFVELAGSWVQWDRSFEPNFDHKAIYDEAGGRWARAYALQRQLVDEGVTTALWKAPVFDVCYLTVHAHYQQRR